ncbi:unnamed protein product [Closterium sp. NIES-54]
MGPPKLPLSSLPIAPLGRALSYCPSRAHGARSFFFPPRASGARRVSAHRAALQSARRPACPSVCAASPAPPPPPLSLTAAAAAEGGGCVGADGVPSEPAAPVARGSVAPAARLSRGASYSCSPEETEEQEEQGESEALEEPEEQAAQEAQEAVVAPEGLVIEGLGFESQCVHFGHPSAGGCQRSTGDPRLILGKGYRLVVLGGYGRTDPLLNKPFYPNGQSGWDFWHGVRVVSGSNPGAFAWGVMGALIRYLISHFIPMNMTGFTRASRPPSTDAYRSARLPSRIALHCPTTSASTATLATAHTAAMASPTVLTFDAEGRAVDFAVWVDDVQLFLQCDSRDGVSLFDHMSGVSTTPTATADSTVRSQWTTRDVVARLAIRSHLPPAERAHFGQYKTAQSLDHFLSLCPTELTVDLLEECLAAAEKSILATPQQQGRARVVEKAAREAVEEVEEAEGVAVEVGVVLGVGASVAAVEVVEAAAEVVESAAAVVEVAAAVVLVEVQPRSVEALVAASASSSCAPVRPRRNSSFVSGTLGVGGLGNVPIFDLDFDAILAAMYAFADSAEGDCYLSVPPDPGIAAAALGASASAAPGTGASAAPGAGAFALSGTTPTEALHTFTLDSNASRSFFRDSTTLTPLSRPVAVSLADPAGGPVLAHSSTVLPCTAALSGLLLGLHLPSFSTNLVSGADLQDAWVDQFTPGGQRVTHCTCSRTGHHLATFTRRPGSSLYTLTTAPPPVPASGQVAASSQVFAAASRSSPAFAPCSCRPLSHETLHWHHRLGHPSLPRLRGMASRALLSGLPRSLPPLPPEPAPTCVPCVEGRQRAAPHFSSFPPTEAPLQTLHMDVWGPARVRGQGHERYFLLVVDDYSRYTTVFPLRSKGEVPEVLQRFGFTYSSPQSTPLPTGHSLSAPPSDESVEPSGPYPELLGCLMYLMTCTRHDLAYPLSLLARYVAPGRHRKVHWDAAKRVLRYLCSTSGMGLVLGGRARVVLTGPTDASWVDDLATQRSSQGYTFSLGSGSVSWRSTRSSSILSSSCEAEIYAGAMAAQELRWLTYLLTDLGEAPRSPPILYVDNKAMLALCQEHRLEHRMKHIALRYFLARELQQRGQFRLAYVASQANTAGVFIKALQPYDHQRVCSVLVLLPIVSHLLTS